jgi:ABC-type glycerol-3-phosphate transport system substrate-binding protein
MMRTSLIVLLAGLGLAACGPQPQSTSNTGSQNRLFDTQRDAMEKAKGVNETVMHADQARRAQEEAQAK